MPVDRGHLHRKYTQVWWLLCFSFSSFSFSVTLVGGRIVHLLLIPHHHIGHLGVIRIVSHEGSLVRMIWTGIVVWHMVKRRSMSPVARKIWVHHHIGMSITRACINWLRDLQFQQAINNSANLHHYTFALYGGGGNWGSCSSTSPMLLFLLFS